MRVFFVCLFALSLLSSSSGQELRVASINLRNYLVQDRRVEDRWRPDHPKPEAEKAAVRRAVMEIDPDILALQEMGPAPFLREFQNDLKAEGMDYPHAILLEASDPDRHLAVLSKIAPVEVIRHTDLVFSYFGEEIPVKRGLLEVLFPVGEESEETWSLFVVHLKSRWSKVDDDPGSSERRTKEAQEMRNRILERFPDADGLYLIAGDFNDHRDSSPLRRFLRRGPVDISRIVEAYDSRGEKWTFFYNHQDLYERVDFFLSSTQLFPFVKGGEGVVFDPLFVQKGTDHRPIYLDLDFGR